MTRSKGLRIFRVNTVHSATVFPFRLQELFIKSKEHYSPIHEIVHGFSENDRDMLPLLHAISGCDTNSFVFGKGKRAFMKAISELKMESELAPLSRGIKDDSSQEVIDQDICTSLCKG